MQDREGIPVTPRQWIEQGSCVCFVGRRKRTSFKFLSWGVTGDLLRLGGEGPPILGFLIGAAPREVMETPPGL